MASTVLNDPAIERLKRAPLFSTERLLRDWRETCRSFLDWEKEHIILASPTPEDKDRHRGTLAWLLRLTRVFDSLLSDPEFPDRSAAGQLKPLLFVLEASWKTICEPLPEAEYDRVLTECFPEDEPRAAGAR